MRRIIVLLLGLCLGLCMVVPLQAATAPAPGIYSLPVELRHATEDRASMGARGLAGQAELVVSEEGMTLYLEALPMEMASIRTSLAAIYWKDGETYREVPAGDLSLAIEGLLEKRPRVFAVPLQAPVDLLPVAVQPQVSIMGEAPLASRLAIDWAALKPIEASPLAEAFAAQPLAATSEGLASASGLSLAFQSEAPSRPMLLASALKGDELQVVKKQLGAAPIALELALKERPETLASLDAPWSDLAFREGVLSFPKFLGSGLYQAEGGEMKPLALRAEGDRNLAQVDHLGVFAITKEATPGATNAAAPIAKASLQASPKATPKAAAPAVKPATAAQAAAPKATAKAAPAAPAPAAKSEAAPAPTAEMAPEPAEKGAEAVESAPAPAQRPEEDRGLIFVILCFYLILCGAAGQVLWRQRHALEKEWARRRYLEALEEAMQ